MVRYAFIFSKGGEMIYLSHLDLIRLFTRALRRAGLPVALTQGFNPRMRLVLKRALKLGVASEAEEAEMVLTQPVDTEGIRQALQAALPAGIEIKKIDLLQLT